MHLAKLFCWSDRDFTHAGVSHQWQNESVRQESKKISSEGIRFVRVVNNMNTFLTQDTRLKTQCIRVSSVKLPLSGTVAGMGKNGGRAHDQVGIQGNH